RRQRLQRSVDPAVRARRQRGAFCCRRQSRQGRHRRAVRPAPAALALIVASHLLLGTRGRQLALWQAHAVAARIAAASGPTWEFLSIRTTGVHLQDAPLSDAGGKRLFVKEIEDALVRGTVDLAVHSSKDMPVELPEGLTIAGVLPREDPRDAV